MSRKMINFDLDTNALKQFYKAGDWHKAYYDIGSFLQKEGFEHRQGSGYITKDNISYAEVQVIVADMSSKFSWLNKCVNKFDVTNIGRTFDITGVIKNDKNDTVTPLQSDELLDFLDSHIVNRK